MAHMTNGGMARRAALPAAVMVGLLALTACGSSGQLSPSTTTSAGVIDPATFESLGACVVDRMQGGTGIDQVQVFQVGHDTALALFLGGSIPAEPAGDPSYLLWVTGAQAPDDGIGITSGGASTPTGQTLGVWIVEPVSRAAAAVGQPACQGDDWGVVRESQGQPAFANLGTAIEMPKSDYDFPGPPSATP